MNKIKAVSFVEFKAIIKKDVRYDLTNTSLISIQEPDTDKMYYARNLYHHQKGDTHNFLSLNFYDIDEPRQDFNTGESLYPIEGHQAIMIFNFVKNRMNMNFLIHCTAGIHRSGAVAQFIHEYLTEHGKEYATTQDEFNEQNPKIKPRKFVLNLLREVSGLEL
jgi:predicted protein tyrosine phosphatase